MKASKLSVVALAAGALVVAGCGDDEDEPSGDRAASGDTATEKAEKPAGGASQTIRLSATDFKFDPENPRVEKPGTVKFVTKNDGQAPHALEVEGPSGEAETETIQPGQSAELSVKLDRGGSFTMYCPVGNHRQMGMEGKVVVAGGGGGASTETETETEDDSGGGGGNSGSGGGGGY
jgi:plastocyanin